MNNGCLDTMKSAAIVFLCASVGLTTPVLAYKACQTLNSVGEMSDNVNRLVEENRSNFQAALKNAQQVLAKTDTLLGKGNEIEESAEKGLTAANVVSKLNSAADNISNVTAAINAIINLEPKPPKGASEEEVKRFEEMMKKCESTKEWLDDVKKHISELFGKKMTEDELKNLENEEDIFKKTIGELIVTLRSLSKLFSGKSEINFDNRFLGGKIVIGAKKDGEAEAD